ncbi:PDZ domain-containing protein 3 [Anas platyrhynchos]|uniref:PDZ domain-containing protein 3 n=1 Tax=Anas platyrhynchos TaxID=8839 RepID=R0KRW3_ANAPL|nr:PDZ domain-containing protein 3 [Anas platyrhynchos]
MKQMEGFEGDRTAIVKFEFNPKDGIDNPALSLAEDTGKYPALLRDQGTWGHPRVELGGLAQRRGLQDGDRLLQVNGRFVDHLDHQRDRVTLLVIDPASDEFYRSLGLSPLLFLEDGDPASGSCTPSLPSPHGSPGLCHVDVGPKGPGSWLVAAANSITIAQSPRKEEQRWLHEAF